MLVKYFLPSQHISSALIQADCRILDVTLAWNERAEWIFLEAGDMCQFLACSLYCKKDRYRQSFLQLLNRWTVLKNIRLYKYIYMYLYIYIDIFVRRQFALGVWHVERIISLEKCPANIRWYLIWSANRELPAHAQTFYVCCIHNWALRLIIW